MATGAASLKLAEKQSHNVKLLQQQVLEGIQWQIKLYSHDQSFVGILICCCMTDRMKNTGTPNAGDLADVIACRCME